MYETITNEDTYFKPYPLTVYTSIANQHLLFYTTRKLCNSQEHHQPLTQSIFDPVLFLKSYKIPQSMCKKTTCYI